MLDTDGRFEPIKPAGLPRNNQNERNKTMHVAINHAITDPTQWEASVRNIMSMIDQHKLTDGRQANCVWESVSLDQVKQFVEKQTHGARNEYFQVNDQAAIGLPTGEPAVAHAA